MLDKNEIDIKMGGGFDPIPADKYTVQIADVSLKSQWNKFKNADQDYLNYQFIVLDDKPMPEDEGETTRGRYLWRRMSQSLNSKSILFKFVRAVYGRDLTPEELKDFAGNPDSIVGKQVDVMVKQNPGDDGATVYNNIIDFSKNVKELETVEFTPQPQDVEVESKPVSSTDASDPTPLEEAMEADSTAKKTKK